MGTVVAMMTRRTPLPGDARSPALARALVRDVVADCGLDTLADEVALLTTELATNAVLHAGTAMQIEASGDETGITVRVTDGSRAVLGPQLPPPILAEGGRGLHLVDALATEWGIDYSRRGKSVWFRLEVSHPSTGRRGAPGGHPDLTTPDEVVGGAGAPPGALRSGTRPSPGAPSRTVALRRSDQGRGPGTRRPPFGRPSRSVSAADTVSWLTFLPDRLVHELDVTQLAGEMLHRACEVTGATFGAVWVDEGAGEGNEALAVVGVPPEGATPPAVLWPDEPPRPRTAELGRPTPALAAAGADLSLSVRVPATPPIRGRLELGAPAGHQFRPADTVFALLAAERIAVSLDAARVRETEQRRRGDLAFLADASELLASSLDVDLTLALVAQLCVPRLGQWCVIHQFDEAGDPELVVVVHGDERATTTIEDAFLEESNTGLRERIRAAGVTKAATPLTAPLSGLVLPLTARREVVGTMTIGDPPGRRHTAEEVAIGVDLARRAALSVDNARLYSERDAAAQALQDALLPASLPQVDGVEFAAEYRPTGAGNDVGGDFYDVVRLDGDHDAADEHWLLAIGDVCGKGPAAASVTGMVRDVLRTLAREGRPLPYALAALNRALQEPGRQSTFCTIAAGLAERDSGGLRVRLCLAGHPLPVLVDHEGGARFVGTSGMAVGLSDLLEVEEVTVRLDPGDALVFFTDGVTERRRGDRQFGEEATLATLARCGGLPAAEVAARLRNAATEFGDGPLRDDLAILVLRALP